jgi:ketosteroid isomerase-like protein
MFPGQPVLKGKKEIRQMVEESFNTPGFKISWEPQSVEVSQSSDMAYLIEKSQIKMNGSSGKQLTMHYNPITVWKKQADGAWKNVVDISTNEP